MLGSFVRHGLSKSDAESEILVQIVAGSDTIATTIRATILHLITSPRVLTRLLSELDAANITTRPWDQIISDSEARSLPYLQAVIKEGLRIFPPAVRLVSKNVPAATGDTYAGVYLPPGTKVGFCEWGIMRNASVWGDDAEEFRPERWLGIDAEKLREMETTLELVFGSERWQCLGRNVALMELNKVFVELLRFEFVFLRPGEPWKSKSAGLFVQSGLWIKGYRREVGE